MPLPLLPRATRLALALLGAPVLLAVLVLAAPSLGWSRLATSDIGMALLAWAPALAALGNARGAAPAWQRRAWALLATGWTLWAIGDAGWAWSDWHDGPGILQRWPNLLYLAHYPCLLAALVQFARGQGDETQRPAREDRIPLAIDVAIVAVAGLAFTWHVVVQPMVAHASASGFAIAASLMAPLLSTLALLAATVLVFRQVGSAARMGFALLALGVFAGYAAGVGTAFAELAPDRPDQRWPELLYACSHALLALGALRARTPDALPGDRIGERTVRTALPAAMAMITYGHLAWDSLRGGDGVPPTMLAGLVVTPLLFAQQYLTARRLHARAAESATERSEARFRSIVQHASDMIAVLDAEDRIAYGTPSLARFLGTTAAQLTGTPLLSLVAEDEVPRVRATLTVAAPGAAPATGTWRLRASALRTRIVEATVENLATDPDVRGTVVTMRDVTERATLAAELRHRSYHDELTGLANRTQFTVRMANALGRLEGEASQLVVMLVGLDGFRAVNDSLGHAVGDALLRQAAERLRSVVREGDLAARLGGNEFAVLLEPGTARAEAEALTARVLEALQRPFTLRQRHATLGASAGLAGGGLEQGGDDLLRHADLALARARTQGSGSFAWFAEALHAEALQRVELTAELREAIEAGQLHVEYQPIVDLATGTTRGLEALVRWQHPRRGPISPAVFIPLAEESGLVLPLGRFVLRAACTLLRAWLRLAGETSPVTVTVNLSPRQLADPQLVDDVRRAIADASLPPGRLVLELTEGTLLQHGDETLRILHALKDAGARLAIDDFGTGYSSLSYLRRFPADVLKLDRSFVDDVAHDSGSAAVARAVIAIGEALGMRVIAEGVASEAQRATLRELGCPFGQGFLFARPMPAAKAIAMLQEQARAARATPRDVPVHAPV